MKKHLLSRIFAAVLALAMLLTLAACDSKPNPSSASNEPSSDPGETTPATTPSDVKAPTITLYPSNASMSSGTIGGYKGDYFKSRGFEVNVWAFSDEKTNAILSSGDLPDVMYVPTQHLDTMIEAGMLLNLDEYLDDMPHVQAYDPLKTALNYIRQYRSAGTNSIYAMPLNVGPGFNSMKFADSSERNAVKLNWAIYEEIGAPKINSMDDLLDVMEAMLKAHPSEEDGTACYGTVLNAGSDSAYWANMTMWFRMQGYDEHELAYLLETNMKDGTNTSILSRDSMYYKGLKWYNEAYNRGLLDPDSISNDRSTQMPKVTETHTMIPSGYLPGWALNYLEYYVPGTSIYYNGDSTYGASNFVLAISAKTKNLDACLAFMDMMADPDAYLITSSGPEGEFWFADEKGDAFFTEAGLEHLKASDMGDFTGFKLASGEELALWNTPFIVNAGVGTSYGDGEGGKRIARSNAWMENNVISTDNELFHQWQETTGYENWMAWLDAENAFFNDSPMRDINTFESVPDDMMKLTVDALRDTVCTASWKMVYAGSEAEFEQLWDQMVTDCEGLGAQDIIDWRLDDIENAMSIRDSLAA